MNNSGFDIIGDIHGYAQPLEKLLLELGYSKQDGIYKHPERTAVFVGDLIDRGPENIKVVSMVRSMVEAGSARAIMGNHEYNAVCFHTPDGNGGYLRPHTDKNIKQHQSFLNEYRDLKDGSAELEKTIDWFRSLPIFIEEENIRIIHACWDKKSLDLIRDQLKPDGSMPNDFIFKSSIEGSRRYQAIETLLKGAEARLPEGISFTDKDGHERWETRLKWWLQGDQSYRSAALVPQEIKEKLPDISVPSEAVVSYGAAEPPVFFGHYWMSGAPTLQADNICCVDYSVAKKGALACYRWNGEQVLSPENFITIKIC